MTESGQATLEFSVSATLIALVLTGAGWILKVNWERAQCAYLVFETTHARVMGRIEPRQSQVQVLITESPSSIQGEGKCGDHTERVVMQKL
jgi:hypothetical protein